uniref:Uncharacterized protein n=1 Tax=Klebsiella pneumoniae TaxID=573 RepID=A0A0U2ZKG5_KLEPN|nr:hypothetical protein pCT-KPC_080 [Klebsiella pneumoniae]
MREEHHQNSSRDHSASQAKHIQTSEFGKKRLLFDGRRSTLNT